jgi:hypothetical protein
MARNQRLNLRQQQFAGAVASGKSFRAAYAETYGTGNSQPQTVARNARHAAGNPKVKERVEALRTELLPGPGDLARIRDHALSVAVEISLHSADDKARLRACEWLYEQAAEADRRLAQAVVVRAPDPTEGVIADLRALYRKAFPAKEPPLVEVANEPAAKAEMPEVEDEPEMPEPVAEGSASGAPLRRELIPGRHPPAYRWVRVTEP